jgi:YbgC/YbaW family acyl-CoA thioester hydrolase
MEHIFEEKVFYADTDAYGVVWHGTYLRWLEKGRVLFCEQLGLNLSELTKNDIALPVATINVKYKASARLDDEIVISTKITKMSPLAITFTQTITDKSTGKLFIVAEIVIVAINNSGKLYRKLPEVITNAFKEAIQCNA